MLEPTEEPARLIIHYRNLVKAVELLVDGRLTNGDVAALVKGGWTFRVEKEERIRAIAAAMVIEHELLAMAGMTDSGEDPGRRSCDERHVKDYRNALVRSKQDIVRRALLEDNRVFNIARPEELMENSSANKQPDEGREDSREDKPANTLAYAQKQKAEEKGKRGVEEP